jgi:hypothetical protein
LCLLNFFNRWLDLCELVSTANLSSDDDEPIWMFHSSGVYNVNSFYAIVNNMGVVLVHTPAVSKLDIPPRIHVFLYV